MVNADSMQLYRGMDIGTAKLTPAERRRRAAPPAGHLGRHRAGQRRRVPAAGPRGDRRHPGPGPGAAAGRRLRAVRAGGAGATSSSPAPTRRCASGWRRSWPRSARRRCTPGCASADPAPRPADPARQRPPDRARAGGDRADRRAVHRRAARARRPYYPSRAARRRPGHRRCWTSGSPRGSDRMWAAGLVDEVRALVGRGLREGRTASRALGYQQVLRFLAGELTEAQAHAETVRATRRFVRRQRSWFRRDPRIHWLDSTAPDLVDAAAAGACVPGRCGDDGRRAQFTKGHGTGNDFVILPDPDGALDLTPALVAALCDRRRGIGARRRAAGGPRGQAPGRRRRWPARPSGSWTTGTPTARSPRCAATASGSSPATCVEHRAGRRRRGVRRWPPGPGVVRALVDGDAIAVEMPPPRVYGTRDATLGGLTLLRHGGGRAATRTWSARSPSWTLSALDLTRAPGVDPAVFPRRGERRVRRGGRAVGRRRPARARCGSYERGSGETLSCGSGRLRGGRGGPARRRPGHRRGRRRRARRPADGHGDGDSCRLAGPAVIVATATDLDAPTAALRSARLRSR